MSFYFPQDTNTQFPAVSDLRDKLNNVRIFMLYLFEFANALCKRFKLEGA